MSSPQAVTLVRSSVEQSIPPDLVSDANRRVRLAALTMVMVWLFAMSLNVTLLQLYPERSAGVVAWPMPGLLVGGVGIALGLLTWWLVRQLPDRDRLSLDVGLGFQVVTGALIAILTQWRPMVVPMRVSWLCVLVVMYPAIAPQSAGRTLWSALLTVSMDPLFFWVAVSRGVVSSMHPQDLVWMFAPNYVSALLAVVPAHVIRRLGRQMNQARELGSYRLGEPLGSGGMGEVFRAQHRLLARPAAIKLVRSDMLGNGASRRVAIERFRREAQAAAVLQSPHTIALYDYGATGEGTFYYAMELLDGPSFEQLVTRHGPVPAERAVHLLMQACESLAEAHTRGLIHRDIKPSNLIAARYGLELDFVKVLDFGLVKFHQGADRPATLTAPDMATGTPAFMAPEAALGERSADHRVDLYSLGCVGYWLLTGQFVFDDQSAARVMQRHITEPPVAPSRRTELPVPPELDEVILACLAKQAADRPATAQQLAERLAAVPLEQPWTADRARRWWDDHLPQPQICGECDQGTLVPEMTPQ